MRRQAGARIRKAEAERLRVLARGPKFYVAGCSLNLGLEALGHIEIARDGSLRVRCALTEAGRAVLAEQERGDA